MTHLSYLSHLSRSRLSDQFKVTQLTLVIQTHLSSALLLLSLSSSLLSAVTYARSQVDSQVNADPCGHDLYEPNNIRSRARNLSQELQGAREVEAHLCRGDQDWYIVWLNRGEIAEFNVVTPLDQPPRLKVFAPRRRKPGGISRRLTPGHRQVRVYAKQSGRYRFLLEGGREARLRYHLYLRRLQPTGI